MASHLHNPMPLPPINDLTCIVTGSTSGIGREIARQLAQAGAHVVMAVRNTKAAQELIQQWQIDSEGFGIALSVEITFELIVKQLMSFDPGFFTLPLPLFSTTYRRAIKARRKVAEAVTIDCEGEEKRKRNRGGKKE
ncbi:hypothetical protein PIB30_029054 [Stylosanthes scabra]|uniref:Uncharacterized protein n=1 Tax=Stylosanthes scabra TaxID=79078 RepID=A0ABU6QAM1_9FABA|nr:hypothetical protein [Stylosanthes scabra]